MDLIEVWVVEFSPGHRDAGGYPWHVDKLTFEVERNRKLLCSYGQENWVPVFVGTRDDCLNFVERNRNLPQYLQRGYAGIPREKGCIYGEKGQKTGKKDMGNEGII
ncbi:MAG: hypothetical protein A4E59_02888 [Syntrophorhabdus sp. PtaB.Bin027]|jgi:hypothetical protein|nr:MAG: hypothetical protein A4E59_02888 [Syntrophorhabdus sp. PtaB.Bin027]